MEHKINIAKLLKECPSGMELDCVLFDGVFFEKVDSDEDLYCPILIRTKEGETWNLTNEGCWDDSPSAKCVIFPKGKTTWEGFVPPFKDGDIVATRTGAWIGITTGGESGKSMPTYCVIKSDNTFEAYLDVKASWSFSRLATEEEKAKLFQAVKDHGYHWNTETKTLEKTNKLTFKDGDIIYNRLQKKICIYYLPENGIPHITSCRYNESNKQLQFEKFKYPIAIVIQDYRLATEDEKQKLFQAIEDNGYKWYPEAMILEKIVTSKFKVGDKIKSKSAVPPRMYTITAVKPTIYTFTDGSFQYVDIIDKDYELINEPKFKVGDRIKKGDNIATIVRIYKNCYDVKYDNGIGTFSIDLQDECELISDKLVESRFKVGDRIIGKYTKNIYTVSCITETGYELTNGTKFDFVSEDCFELISHKFDIAAFKPFDKVLARCGTREKWRIQFFEKYDKDCKFPFICMGYNKYNQCIPYENNEYLLDTADNCDEFYKNW